MTNLKLRNPCKDVLGKPTFFEVGAQDTIFHTVVGFGNIQCDYGASLFISTGKLEVALQVNMGGPNGAAWTKAYLMWTQNIFRGQKP